MTAGQGIVRENRFVNPGLASLLRDNVTAKPPGGLTVSGRWGARGGGAG